MLVICHCQPHPFSTFLRPVFIDCISSIPCPLGFDGWPERRLEGPKKEKSGPFCSETLAACSSASPTQPPFLVAPPPPAQLLLDSTRLFSTSVHLPYCSSLGASASLVYPLNLAYLSISSSFIKVSSFEPFCMKSLSFWDPDRHELSSAFVLGRHCQVALQKGYIHLHSH